jgi:hypothetical protein
MNDRRQVTEKEFAQLVGLRPKTLGNYRRAQKVKHRRVGNKVFYLLPDDLNAWWDAACRESRGAPFRRSSKNVLKQVG